MTASRLCPQIGICRHGPSATIPITRLQERDPNTTSHESHHSHAPNWLEIPSAPYGSDACFGLPASLESAGL